MFCECTTFTEVPLACDLGLKQPWNPTKKTQVDVPFDAAKMISSNERQRSFAMRRAIRRFSVWMHEVEDPDAKKELRLLSQPLVQWSEPSTGSFAMCFGYAETNDPEALVVLRYTPDKGSDVGTWSYSLSRMTSRPLVFELDGESIHRVKAYWRNPRTVSDSYIERKLGNYPSN